MRAVSLCSGYGGLDLAVEAALGCETVAFSEVDPKAASVFQRHWPDAEPLGDLTEVDWHAKGVMPDGSPAFDVLTAGFP